MGRTLATIIQIIHQEESAWAPFRRTLRKEDQEAFDELWRHVRHHAAAASMANRPISFEALLMAMLLGLTKDIQRLKKNLSDPAIQE